MFAHICVIQNNSTYTLVTFQYTIHAHTKYINISLSVYHSLSPFLYLTWPCGNSLERIHISVINVVVCGPWPPWPYSVTHSVTHMNEEAI